MKCLITALISAILAYSMGVLITEKHEKQLTQEALESKNLVIRKAIICGDFRDLACLDDILRTLNSPQNTSTKDK